MATSSAAGPFLLVGGNLAGADAILLLSNRESAGAGTSSFLFDRMELVRMEVGPDASLCHALLLGRMEASADTSSCSAFARYPKTGTITDAGLCSAEASSFPAFLVGGMEASPDASLYSIFTRYLETCSIKTYFVEKSVDRNIACQYSNGDFADKSTSIHAINISAGFLHPYRYMEVAVHRYLSIYDIYVLPRG